LKKLKLQGANSFPREVFFGADESSASTSQRDSLFPSLFLSFSLSLFK